MCVEKWTKITAALCLNPVKHYRKYLTSVYVSLTSHSNSCYNSSISLYIYLYPSIIETFLYDSFCQIFIEQVVPVPSAYISLHLHVYPFIIFYVLAHFRDCLKKKKSEITFFLSISSERAVSFTVSDRDYK